MEPEPGRRRVLAMDVTLGAPPVDGGARTEVTPSARAAPADGPAADAPPADPPAVKAPAVRSFDGFYAASRTRIGRAVALAVGDVDLAADATDEAMARAYERWHLVSRLERPEGWVYRVAVNWATSVLRRRRRSLHRLYQPADDDDPAAVDPALHEALAALDVKHRSAVVCRHLLGWSTAETAEALGVSEGTVKSRLHRALRQLESRLGHLRATEDAP